MHTRSHDMRLHHVGVITGTLEGSMNFCTSLGYVASAIYADPMQKARIMLVVLGRSIHTDNGMVS